VIPGDTLRIRTVRLAAPAVAALLAAATACGGSSSASDTSGTSGTRLKVVATTTQVADFARNVGGDKVKVTQILKPNVDPHDYEPSPADVQAIAQADVVVESGVGLEKWLDQTIQSAGFHGTLVDSSKGVTVRKGNGTDEEAAGDPHICTTPRTPRS
jgi:zinc/manganese transport system substrate-binding protein/manganese/iron transport system substrate-binding protein